MVEFCLTEGCDLRRLVLERKIAHLRHRWPQRWTLRFISTKEDTTPSDTWGNMAQVRSTVFHRGQWGLRRGHY